MIQNNNDLHFYLLEDMRVNINAYRGDHLYKEQTW